MTLPVPVPTLVEIPSPDASAETVSEVDDAREKLLPAADLMRARPAAVHTVMSLARLVGMSRTHFAESFKRCYARTPMEFLRSMRLNGAAVMLRDGVVPIKLIAARSGYASRTAFADAFRHEFDMSPAEFRVSHASPSRADVQALSEHVRELESVSKALTWEVDLVNNTVWWSRGTFVAFGYKPEKRGASNIARFYERVHPDDRGRVVASIGSACGSTRLTWDQEFRFQKADGAYVATANGCLILRDTDGFAFRLIGVTSILVKTSGQKETE